MPSLSVFPAEKDTYVSPNSTDVGVAVAGQPPGTVVVPHAATLRKIHDSLEAVQDTVGPTTDAAGVDSHEGRIKALETMEADIEAALDVINGEDI